MNRYIVLLFYIFIVLVSCFLYFNVDTVLFSDSLLHLTLLLIPVSFFPFIFHHESVVQLRGQYLRPILVFIIGFLIVHFQKYVDYCLGNIAFSDLNGIVSMVTINKAALLSLAGLASILAGYQFYRPKVQMDNFVSKDKSCRVISLQPLVVLLMIIFLIIIVFYREYYLSSRYGEKENSMRVYFELMFNASFFSIVTINCQNAAIKGINTLTRYLKSFGLLFYVIYFGFILLIIISGDRGAIIYTTTALFFSYIIILKRKIRLLILLVMILGAAIVISLMGFARSLDKDISYFDRLTIASQEYERQSFSPYTVELSGSSRTLEYAIEYVPEMHPFLYGLFKLNDVISVIPFSSNITKLFMNDSFQYKGSASFLTWIEQGDDFSSGVGSTVVADLYLDWGWIGVVVILFLLGLLFRKLDYLIFCKAIDQIPLFFLILAIILFAMAIYIPRSSLLLQFRLIVWVWIITNVYKSIISSDVQ